MSTISPSSLHLSTNQLPSSLAPSLHKSHAPASKLFTTGATTDPETPAESESTSGSKADDPFDSRLAQLRIRNRSGLGKKAESRKSKKGASTSSAAKPRSSSLMSLPPVALKEAKSGGLKVDFGFSPYSERINGRIAMLGSMALLAVELATGKGVLNYQTLAIVLLQVYFVAAIGALFVKYEKEKVSVWRQPKNEN
ncbi:hypothetical protein Ddye_028594 [Dipteronia dyeriana]|uniref:Uncharacterized protein n=1 Tax=Dipteronia dyeriana TaxID=168575 RepID=A0AAD9TCZ8_9ROSI|nr:hypothetical protein Ddye_028594 [Dipteronia dyeriana]